MVKQIWQLTAPLNAVVFDCDGTLSSIEGIDELARKNSVYKEVAYLTQLAMESGDMNENLYRERLQLVQPSKMQLEELVNDYVNYATRNVGEVIQLLQEMGKVVYVISAGLYPAVEAFANKLGVSADNVFAVDVYFDDCMRYAGFDRLSPLVRNDGKCEIIRELQKKHEHLTLLGDGMNDIVAREYVDFFVGYGGAFPRPRFEEEADFYIKVGDLAALLPLVFTGDEVGKMSSVGRALYEQGVRFVDQQEVVCNLNSG